MGVDQNENENQENNEDDPSANENEISERNRDRRLDNVESEAKETAVKYSEKNRQRDNEKSNHIHSIRNSTTNMSEYKDDTKEAALLVDSKTLVRFSPVWKQTLSSMGSILLTFTAGLTSGYSAILLPQLEQSSNIPSDANTASWIAAMAALPMAPGCLISGWLMEKFGRRNAHYIVCAPFLLGWILIASADNLALMLLGRFFTGLCVGLLGPLGPVFIGETTSPEYRGIFLAGISLAIAVGIFVAHVIGTWIHWQWTALICCTFPVLSVFLLSMVPESPVWLISKGQVDDGVKAFNWLRGYGNEAKIELKAIIDKRKAADLEEEPSLTEKLKSLKSPELIKPLFIMMVFFITCQFSGVNAVAFYSIQIIDKAVGNNRLNNYMAMILIDSLRLVMSVIACITCKKFGRRPLCMISGMFTAVSMGGLSLFLYWTADKPANGLTWIPLTCLMTYICAISIGLVPLPWMMCGELFPAHVRGLGSGISSATAFTAFFIVVKTAPGMMLNLGEIFTFLFYGIVSFFGTAILYFILPETKGKSLQEIEEKFRRGKISIV